MASRLLDARPEEPSPGPGSAESVTGLTSRKHHHQLRLCSGICKHPKVPTQAVHGKAQGHSRGVQVGGGNASGPCAPARDHRTGLGAFLCATRKPNSVRIKEMEGSLNWLRKLCISLRQLSNGIQTK